MPVQPSCKPQGGCASSRLHRGFQTSSKNSRLPNPFKDNENRKDSATTHPNHRLYAGNSKARRGADFGTSPGARKRQKINKYVALALLDTIYTSLAILITVDPPSMQGMASGFARAMMLAPATQQCELGGWWVKKGGGEDLANLNPG